MQFHNRSLRNLQIKWIAVTAAVLHFDKYYLVINKCRKPFAGNSSKSQIIVFVLNKFTFWTKCILILKILETKTLQAKLVWQTDGLKTKEEQGAWIFGSKPKTKSLREYAEVFEAELISINHSALEIISIRLKFYQLFWWPSSSKEYCFTINQITTT